MAQNYFEIIVQKMIELGFYGYFFPWLITFAIAFALFQKSKILGENVKVNGVVALALAFLVFGFPVITGTSLAEPISIFFTQTVVVAMVFVMVIVIASIFHPKIFDYLTEKFSAGALNSIIAIVIGLLVVSSLVTVFWSATKTPEKPGEIRASSDIRILIVILIAFIAFLVIASQVGVKD